MKTKTRTRTSSSLIKAQELQNIKCLLKKRLVGKSDSPILVGLDKPYKTLYDTIERTIRYGESNSTILVGPRGSGKTSLVKKVLYDLNKELSDSYFLLKLSGLVHINDRVALKSIASQLNQNMSLEDNANRSAAEWMNFLISIFQNGDKSSKPVVFILENFELFALQPKQLLLYTLFDIAQSRQAPVVVIGVTSRLNVVDLLEKRVKSRFSHRLINVPLISNIEEFFMIAHNNLLLPFNGQDNIDPKFAQEFNSKTKECLFSSEVSAVLTFIYNLGKDIQLMNKLLMLAVTSIKISNPFISSNQLFSLYQNLITDPKINLLNEVSLLELYLLISIKSLVSAGNIVFNYEMIYDEYKKMANQYIITSTFSGGSIKIYKKEVAFKAYEYLIQIEFIQPCINTNTISSGMFVNDDLHAISSRKKKIVFGSGSNMKEFQMVKLLLDPNEIVKAAESRKDIPMAIRRWFCEI
ncbi:hypothetical protein BB561_002790 [Smittium simulii]|uniref:Origin recognition complex subunit 4 n=1 Tax=Smittium simulii TaxID=133385 RepID=A0A2T9YP56_9FUNG|nr:hypothetical protein BB561_002790 [Smittium simulii]